MARLFITPREVDFIADITKEVTKDVVGQKIFYYKIREDLTNVHDVYEEAPEKVFDPPVELEALVEWEPQVWKTGRFGSEEMSTISVNLQSRDLLDKEVVVKEGDYFSYGALFFEITSIVADKNIYGQVEHKTGVKLVGKQARRGLIDMKPIGPTDESHTDDDAVQTEFVQQRGQEENKLGPTNDVRQLQKDGKLDAPISGPHEVSNEATEVATTDSAFYGDDC